MSGDLAEHDLARIGEHAPALVCVFEYEAEPWFSRPADDRELERIMEWLARAHPVWFGLFVEASAAALERAGIELPDVEE